MNKIKQIAIIVLIALTLTFSVTLCLAENPEQGVCFGQLGYKYTPDGKTTISASFEGYETIGSGVVICMLYNFDDELADICIDKISDLSLGYTKTPYVEFEKCRLMLWESLESIKPLCADKQISVSDITKKIITVSFDVSDVDLIHESLPQGDMIYGAKFNLPSESSLTKAGYVLSGFTVNGEEKAFGEEITVGEEEITIVPIFTRLISYNIEYYRQNSARDGYNLYTTDSSKAAPEGELITIDMESLHTYRGYIFNENHEENILSATQTSDGVTLKVYYDRLVVSLECYRHNPYVTGYYLYETKIISASYVNSVMTVDDLTLPEYPNYSYNISAEGSIHSGTVTKDGLTLRVYYDLIIDEAAQDEVILRLKRILTDLNTISFTKNERKVLSTVISTINQTLKDAENGAYIYMEGYVQEYYGEKVEIARLDAEGLKATDEFEPFKSKLGQLRGNDVKFLAKTMLGIDDIDKWL